MIDTTMFKGFFAGKVFENKDVLKEMDMGDPVGEAVARKKAFDQLLLGQLPGSYEQVGAFGNANTIMDAWYDTVFNVMIKGDALTIVQYVGLYGLDVTPSASLLIDTFEASLGEATGYTVDGGNTTNRSSSTFAASSSQSITNSASPSRFTFTGTDTIYGAMMLQGAPLKSGAGDVAPAVLMAAGKFGAAQPVALASIIDVVYTQSKA